MKSVRSLKAVRILVLAILATGLSAGLAKAQQFTGKFTLPVETYWGSAVLPAGTYSFSLDAASPYTIAIRRKTRDFMAYVLPGGRCLHGAVAGHSELMAIRKGGTLRIRELRLAEADLTLGYSIPKVERRFMAQEGPELFQRIDVTMNGKRSTSAALHAAWGAGSSGCRPSGRCPSSFCFSLPSCVAPVSWQVSLGGHDVAAA